MCLLINYPMKVNRAYTKRKRKKMNKKMKPKKIPKKKKKNTKGPPISETQCYVTQH